MATITPLDEEQKKKQEQAQIAQSAAPVPATAVRPLPAAVGTANMTASAPMQPGQPTSASSARPAWVAQGQQLGAATNAQLDLASGGIGSNRAKESRRVLDMVKRVDPRITEDINARRAFRMMTPQQRREHIGLEKAKREAFGVENAINYGWDEIQAGSRNLSDATGMALDSYGSSDQFYTPDQMAYKRQGYREFDKQWGDILSNVDRTAWDNPNDAYDAAMSTDAAKKYGPFIQSYIFSKIREFASPKMRAQMEATQRNQRGFSQWLSRKTEQELIEMGEATGLRLTNDGTLKDAAPEYFKNRDSDLGAGALYNMYLDETPVTYMEENGRVVVDPAQQPRYERAQQAIAEKKKAEQEKADEGKRAQAAQAEIDMAVRVNPSLAGKLAYDPNTGNVRNYEAEYGAKPAETDWDEIYRNSERATAVESMLEWAKFTTPEEAMAAAASQFPTDPSLPPNDPKNSENTANQARAFEIWRTQVNPPEKRAELERELYNLKLRDAELKANFKDVPVQKKPTETRSAEEYQVESAIPSASEIKPSSPSSTGSKVASAESYAITHSAKKSYQNAGAYRVGEPVHDSVYSQYKQTGRISIGAMDSDKIPISVTIGGKNEYVTLVDPGQLAMFMNKKNVGPASPVKVRVVPIEDIADINISDAEVEKMRNRFGISPFASKKQVLAVAADRINSKNKKAVHPFKNMFDWSPDLQWFQA